MRVLLIHPEPEWFAGAEKMLQHFLSGAGSSGLEVTVALVKGSKLDQELNPGVARIWIEDDRRFSLRRLWRQALILREKHRDNPFDLVHGWAARDWELTALTSWLTGRPGVGTLHDHPLAGFHSRGRRMLMRLSARKLARVICVSGAVLKACQGAGYPEEKLVVIHNGLPGGSPPSRERTSGPFQLGFLGVFVKRKGLRELFMILDALGPKTSGDWEIKIGGGTQDPASEQWVESIRQEYRSRDWWGRVRWCGWVKAGEFLRQLDLLICPSSEFDPFPTVLLEAGQSGTAVLAWKVGGVEEIVRDGETGWTIGAGQVEESAERIAWVMEHPRVREEAGEKAVERVQREFSIGKMVARYEEVYSTAQAYV
jgi:glycosyltransferase involved in cell wall biosynthesis